MPTSEADCRASRCCLLAGTDELPGANRDKEIIPSRHNEFRSTLDARNISVANYSSAYAPSEERERMHPHP